MEFISLLKYTELFTLISEEEIREFLISNSYHIKEYKKNSIIHLQNEVCLYLDIILDGKVSIQGIDSNGKYISIGEFSNSDTLGGNLLFSQNNFYPMMVFAKSDTKILHINKSSIINICQTNTLFLTNFLKSISNKTIFLTSKIKTLSLKSIKECIVDFLIYENYIQKSNTIVLNITKKELAEKFGVKRTSLSRELKKLKDNKIIDFNSKSITILNKEKLLNLKNNK